MSDAGIWPIVRRALDAGAELRRTSPAAKTFSVWTKAGGTDKALTISEQFKDALMKGGQITITSVEVYMTIEGFEARCKAQITVAKTPW